MRSVFKFMVLFFLISCRSGSAEQKPVFSRLVPDTAQDRNAGGDMQRFQELQGLTDQLGYRDISHGVPGLEVRIWEDASFREFRSLTVFRLQDSGSTLSTVLYFVKDPFVKISSNGYKREDHLSLDSCLSFIRSLSPIETDLILARFHAQGPWTLLSQYQLPHPERFGGTDGSCYSLEMADSSNYRFVVFNNPLSSFSRTRDSTHKRFLDVINSIRQLDKGSLISYFYRQVR